MYVEPQFTFKYASGETGKMAHDGGNRAPRADSARNRLRILGTARRLIDSVGAEVPMAEIAAEAGVAVGTLYNHFPTKSDLVAAIVSDYVREVAGRAVELREEVEAGAPAGASLFDFLAFVMELTARSQAAKIANGGVTSAAAAESEQRAAAELAWVIGAAQDEGSVRPDLTVEDLYLLINTAPLGATSAQRSRWLDLLTTGLRQS